MKKLKTLLVVAAVSVASVANLTSCSAEQLTACAKLTSAFSVFQSAQEEYEKNPGDASLCNTLRQAAKDYISYADDCTSGSVSEQLSEVEQQLNDLANCEESSGDEVGR